MSKWGDKKRGVDAYFNDNFVPGVIDRLVKIVEHGQKIDEEYVLGTVHRDTGDLAQSVRRLKVKRYKDQIVGSVRMGGKMVDGKMVDYAWAEEMRHAPMRTAAKSAGPAIRASVASFPVL